MITLAGNLESITYQNKENHYTIAKLSVDGTRNLITIIGYMAGITPGEAIRVRGKWETHPRYGQQFKVDSFEVTLHATVDGIRGYLASGVVRGVGPKMAERLVDHFKEQTLFIIEKNPEYLTSIEGIGEKKAEQMHQAWQEHHSLRRLMQFLQENGLKLSYAAKIFREYGADAVDIVSEEPYRVAYDIPGVGFIIADTIAQNRGAKKDDPKRIKACIMFLLEQSVSQGDTFIIEDELIQKCFDDFEIGYEQTTEILEMLSVSGDVVKEKSIDEEGKATVYDKYIYEAETGVAKKIEAMLTVPIEPYSIESGEIAAEVHKKLAIDLSPEQLEIIEEVLAHRMAVITGGPGTGKTTLVRSLNTIFEAYGEKVCLAAPTGRAARRLSEVSGKKAETIHKLLGYSPQENTFQKNQDHPIDASVIIIDEASMIDTLLMFYLIRSVSLTSRFYLVGDIFQLPSVGPGNVLSDIIQSNRVKEFKLHQIFRQSDESLIITNAHKVREGEDLDLEEQAVFYSLKKHQEFRFLEKKEFYFIKQDEPERAVSIIIELCCRSIPSQFNLNPINDIQVITPMHKGVIGTINLNQVLQKALNQHTDSFQNNGSTFKYDDKVMHLKNNYQKEVFNGDIGRISGIDMEERKFSVVYDDRSVEYDFTEVDEISLAYAITVHKSQGSEYPAVIVPLMTQHFALLQRNLLYTAMTRGKELVVLIGTKRALDIALKNDKPKQRLSGLAKRLTE
ncbi:MAG: ATP-dependent RecD-like DNA helicase [Desulfobacterales bacterium]|nr:ATP-dependent RecD-like DNA helicase [Desulfobacterales bacterium]